MADSTTEIDLDSVIDRLLEGELLSIDIMFSGGKRVWWGRGAVVFVGDAASVNHVG